MVFIIIIALLLALYVFLSFPASKKEMHKKYCGARFAHRGLHGNGTVENTLTAFNKAVNNGLPIELDVRLTKDKRLVVFHDDDLYRLLNIQRRVDDISYDELKNIRFSSGDCIPLFSQVLSVVNGSVPLLVEIKPGKDINLLCEKTAALLDNYKGEYIIESFNPMALRWFKKNRKNVLRGQLWCGVSEFKKGTNTFISCLLHLSVFNFLSKPNFLAYDLHAQKSPVFFFQTRVFKVFPVAWTVKNKDTAQNLKNKSVAYIFEGEGKI